MNMFQKIKKKLHLYARTNYLIHNLNFSTTTWKKNWMEGPVCSCEGGGGGGGRRGGWEERKKFHALPSPSEVVVGGGEEGGDRISDDVFEV